MKSIFTADGLEELQEICKKRGVNDWMKAHEPYITLPNKPCDFKDCSAIYNQNTQTWSAGCIGSCQ